MLIHGFTRYGGPEVAGPLEVPDAELPAGASPAVLVELLATTVNPADIKVREGLRAGKVQVDFPMAMGREAAGRVFAASPGTGFEVGDPVVGGTFAGTGSYAEKVLLDAAQTTLIPDGVPAEQAACVPVALGTAWDAVHELRDAGLPDGGTVVVLGAGGGVGHAAVQLARHLGFTVVGVASESKQDLVTDLGATFVESGTDWVERLGDADAIVDTVGPPVLDDFTFRFPEAPVRSTAGGPAVTRRRSGPVFAEILELIAAGHVKAHISEVHRLSDAATAVATVEDGHAVGKVVIVT